MDDLLVEGRSIGWRRRSLCLFHLSLMPSDSMVDFDEELMLHFSGPASNALLQVPMRELSNKELHTMLRSVIDRHVKSSTLDA